MTIFFIFLIGLVVGSFLNVLIDRLPKGESVVLGRSYCDHCQRQLAPIDLIPVISYIFFKGRCRTCNKPISVYYPIIEILTAVIFVFVWIQSYSNVPNVNGLVINNMNEIPRSLYSLGMTISLLGIVSSLIVIFFADLKYRIIPDEMNAALFVFSAPISIMTSTLPSRVIAALILFGMFHLLYAATKGRGIGYGDVKYAAAMGFILGLLSALAATYIAFVVGGFYGLGLILFGKHGLKSKIAFGPFLVGGTVVMLFWQNEVMTFISRFLGINL